MFDNFLSKKSRKLLMFEISFTLKLKFDKFIRKRILHVAYVSYTVFYQFVLEGPVQLDHVRNSMRDSLWLIYHKFFHTVHPMRPLHVQDVLTMDEIFIPIYRVPSNFLISLLLALFA